MSSVADNPAMFFHGTRDEVTRAAMGYGVDFLPAELDSVIVCEGER